MKPSKKTTKKSSATTTATIKNSDGSETAASFQLLAAPVSDKIHLLENGVKLDKGLDVGTWTALGVSIASASKRSLWMLGDWLNYGQGEFPKDYRKAVEATGLEYQTLRMVASVCKRFPSEKRIEGLSFEHHRTLAPVKDEATVKQLAEKAIDSKLSVKALKVLTPPAADKKPLTEAQQAAQAKKADDTALELAGKVLLHIPTIPLANLGKWVTVLASMQEVCEKGITAYNASAKKTTNRK